MANWKSIAAGQITPATDVLAELVAQAKASYEIGEISKARAEVDTFLDAVGIEALERLVALDKEVADFCTQQGDMEHGEAILKRCVQLVEAIAGPEHVMMAIALANLGKYYLKNDNAVAALPVFESCFQIVEKAAGTDSLGVAAICGLLQTCHKELAQFSSAEAYGKRALEIRERLLHSDDLAVMTSRTELAKVYQIQAKYSLALPLLQKNLIESERNVSPDVLSALQGKENSKVLTDFVAQNRAKAVLLAESYGHSGGFEKSLWQIRGCT